MWPFRRRPAPVVRGLTIGSPFAPLPSDCIDLAVEFLEDVPAHQVGVAIYARLLDPSPKGGTLSSEQLYEISNRIGRLAHAKARQEDELRAFGDRVMSKVREAVANYRASQAQGGRDAD